MLRAAFGVDLAVVDDRLEPAKVSVVVCNDNLKVLRAPRDG